ELLRLTSDIEDVVRDLKSETEIFRKDFDASEGRGADVGEHSADCRSSDEQRSSFSRVNELERVEVQLRAFAVKIDRLSGNRSIPTDRFDDALNHLLQRPLTRIERGMILRNESVCMIQQRHRGQNREVFAELAMQR